MICCNMSEWLQTRATSGPTLKKLLCRVHWIVVQAALWERYAMLPYLYSLFWVAHRTGEPIMRPLWYEFPDQPDLFQEQQTFMFGPALYVAPVLEPAATTINVIFPSGSNWYNAASGALVPAAPTGRTSLSVMAESIPR
jgi:hypothetical protein